MSSSSSARAPVKRQYGSRKSSTPLSARPGSRSYSNQSTITTSSEWSDMLDEADNASIDAPGLSVKRIIVSTPPTSPETLQVARSDDCRSSAVKAPEVKEDASEGSTSAPPRSKTTNGPTDLRSFFKQVSPPRKKQRLSLSAPSNDENTPLTLGAFRTLRAEKPARSSAVTRTDSAVKRSAHSVSRPKSKQLEQLFLDPFETSGHSTLSCAECSLSYARTPEDMNLHARHHKRAVGGVDWVSAGIERKSGRVQVLNEVIDWDKGKSSGRLLMVDASADGAVGRRVTDVLATIDTQLCSTSLTSEQLADCRLFMIVTTKRKVITCAVVQRINKAYEMVKDDATDGARSNSLMRFGEDETAIFCSPKPVPVLLGVQRIWTSSTHRRQGLATRLLDAAASSLIYGHVISQGCRATDVAFSQPTGKGQALARSWTGTDRFRVFVD